TMLVKPAGERLSHLVLQPFAEIVDHGAHDPPHFMQDSRIELTFERKQRLEQRLAGLDASEHLWVAHEFGQAVAVEGVALDDLDRLARNQLAPLAQPADDRWCRGIQRSCSRLLRVTAVRATATSRILAAVEILKRPLVSLTVGAWLGETLLRV